MFAPGKISCREESGKGLLAVKFCTMTRIEKLLAKLLRCQNVQWKLFELLRT
jgi:hypothetical protein